MRVRHQYPSSVENAFNCIHCTGSSGPCIDVVLGGVVIDAERWKRMASDLVLTSQEALAKFKEAAAKVKKAVRDNVRRLRAEYSNAPLEPERISLDELAARDEGKAHEEEAD